MINLRSSLSALALVGAFVGFSSAAHAAPALSDLTAAPLNAGDVAAITVTDKAASGGSYYVSVLNNDNSTVTSVAIGGNSFVLTAVDFTLQSGNGVTWTDSDYNHSKFASVIYQLVDGSPTQGSTSYGSLPVLASSRDTFALSGLTAGHSYALLIEGLPTFGTGSYAISGTLSAVPLPGSLVMFGSALLGLTALGARRRSAISA